jgi:hypothetical protein
MPIDLKNTTCALWLPKDYDLTLITEVVDSIKGNIISVTRKNRLVGLSDVIIFVDEENIDEHFFNDETLLEKLEKLNLFIVIVGTTKKLKRIPPQVQFISKPIISKKQVLVIIDIWQRYRQNLNKREQALTVKLNRLFFIYHKLFEGEYLYIDDIIKMASVTKRTILRDLKILRDVLVTKEITFDEEKRAYIMEDIKK